jgi:hypothetical protein
MFWLLLISNVIYYYGLPDRGTRHPLDHGIQPQQSGTRSNIRVRRAIETHGDQNLCDQVKEVTD